MFKMCVAVSSGNAAPCQAAAIPETSIWPQDDLVCLAVAH